VDHQPYLRGSDASLVESRLTLSFAPLTSEDTPPTLSG
jgi:hypothetical protein